MYVSLSQTDTLRGRQWKKFVFVFTDSWLSFYEHAYSGEIIILSYRNVHHTMFGKGFGKDLIKREKKMDLPIYLISSKRVQSNDKSYQIFHWPVLAYHGVFLKIYEKVMWHNIIKLC